MLALLLLEDREACARGAAGDMVICARKKPGPGERIANRDAGAELVPRDGRRSSCHARRWRTQADDPRARPRTSLAVPPAIT